MKRCGGHMSQKILDKINEPVSKKTEERVELFMILMLFLIGACLQVLLGCAPKDDMACTEPTPMVCSNTCDGLYAYKENTRVLYFDNHIDCTHGLNVVYIEEGADQWF